MAWRKLTQAPKCPALPEAEKVCRWFPLELTSPVFSSFRLWLPDHVSKVEGVGMHISGLRYLLSQDDTSPHCYASRYLPVVIFSAAHADLVANGKLKSARPDVKLPGQQQGHGSVR